MKAVIYHRVSTDEQDETTARNTLLEEAKRRGFEVEPGHLIEETGSGAINNRPGLQHLMGLVRQRKVKFVIVWAIDRFGRNTMDVLSNIAEVRKYGCTFISAHENMFIKPEDDAATMFQLTIMSACAQFERDRNRARTREGMKRVRLHGSKSGLSIGGQYKFTKLLSRDYEKVQRLRQEGKSIRVIAAELGCSKKEVENAVRRIGATATAAK